MVISKIIFINFFLFTGVISVSINISITFNIVTPYKTCIKSTVE